MWSERWGEIDRLGVSWEDKVTGCADGLYLGGEGKGKRNKS